jgi:hypothetical protein
MTININNLGLSKGAVLGLALFNASAAVSAPIEGANNDVLLAASNPLKSVLKIRYKTKSATTGKIGEASCSSSLIGSKADQYLLLTAKHCTDGLVTSKPILVEGSGVRTLYQVNKIKSPDALESLVGGKKLLSDVAVIELSTIQNPASSSSVAGLLQELVPLEIAKPQRAANYSTQFVVAGYGFESFYQLKNDVPSLGHINAGMGSLVQSNYGKLDLSGMNGVAANEILPALKGIADDSLVSVAFRQDTKVAKLLAGSEFQIQNSLLNAVNYYSNDGMAAVLSGDSGGPMLIQDSDQNWIQIGVTSSMISLEIPKVEVSVFTESTGEIEMGLFPIALLKSTDGLSVLQKSIQEQIEQKSGMNKVIQLNENKVLTVSEEITVVLSVPRMMASQFSSLVSSQNSVFISEQIAQFLSGPMNTPKNLQKPVAKPLAIVKKVLN